MSQWARSLKCPQGISANLNTQQVAVGAPEGGRPGQQRGVQPELREQHPYAQGGTRGDEGSGQRGCLGNRGGREMATRAGEVVKLVPQV